MATSFNPLEQLQKRIFKESFLYVSTYGVPLDIIMIEASKRGFITDLGSFLEDAIIHGWKPEKAIAEMNEAINMLVNIPNIYFTLPKKKNG